jgi:3-methyladenine DNA glycosylase Mpg
MTKLTREFFARRSDAVAQDLLGRTVVARDPEGTERRLTLTEVAAYEGKTKTTSEGTQYGPGRISISTKFGNKLIDIATAMGGVSSCVTLRAGEDAYGESVKGPGNVTKALDVRKETQDFYETASVYGNRLWVEGEAYEGEVRKTNGNSANCLGFYKI